MTSMIVFLFAFVVTVLVYGHQRKTGQRTIDSEIEMRPTTALLGVTIRDYFFWLMEPALRLAQKLNLTPTHLNILGMMFGGLGGMCFFLRWYSWGGMFLILSGLCDAMDGRLARRQKIANNAGAFLDATMDRIGEGLAFIGLALSSVNLGFQFLVMIALMGAQMVSYTRAKGETFSIPTNTGFMQRPERMVLLIVFSLFAPLAVGQLHLTFEVWMSLGMGIIALGAWGTVVHRILLVVRSLS